jgi:peptide/nickel transport system permease protein
MVQVGFQYLQTAPWFAAAPAVAIFVAVLAFTMLAEGLRGVVDPASSHYA